MIHSKASRANDSENFVEPKSENSSDYKNKIDAPSIGDLNGRIDLINGVLPCVFDTEGKKKLFNLTK